jgi:hypothetical protein
MSGAMPTSDADPPRLGAGRGPRRSSCPALFLAAPPLPLPVAPAGRRVHPLRVREAFRRGRRDRLLPGGPHAEGATDFLWFLGSPALHAVGIDIALAAEPPERGRRPRSRRPDRRGGPRATRGARDADPARRPAPPRLAGPAVAAILGFSSLFFSARRGVASRCASRAPARARARPWIPWAALLLALIRPDGVVLGAGFALVGWIAPRAPGSRAATSCAACGAAASDRGYFAWRWSYFGSSPPAAALREGPRRAGVGADLLSDPAPFFAGAEMNLGWLRTSGRMAAARGARPRPRPARRSASGESPVALPLLLHLVVLGLARQSQNLGFRFQAPAQTALLVLLVLAAAGRSRASRPSPRASSSASSSVAGDRSLAPLLPVSRGRGSRVYEIERSYVDVFGAAPRRDPRGPADSVCSATKAGRIPYWSRAQDVRHGRPEHRAHGARPAADGGVPRARSIRTSCSSTSAKTVSGHRGAGSRTRRPAASSRSTRATLAREHPAGAPRASTSSGLAGVRRRTSPDRPGNVITSQVPGRLGRRTISTRRGTWDASATSTALKRGIPARAPILEALRAMRAPGDVPDLREQSARSLSPLRAPR